MNISAKIGAEIASKGQTLYDSYLQARETGLAFDSGVLALGTAAIFIYQLLLAEVPDKTEENDIYATIKPYLTESIRKAGTLFDAVDNSPMRYVPDAAVIDKTILTIAQQAQFKAIGIMEDMVNKGELTNTQKTVAIGYIESIIWYTYDIAARKYVLAYLEEYGEFPDDYNFWLENRE
jgi:hypothetical protein